MEKGRWGIHLFFRVKEVKTMRIGIYYKLSRIAYNLFVRRILKKAINDPDKEWDNYTMEATDLVFGYKKRG